MEEKKNIRELAVQYFEGRIRRKDEKLLFEYVGQSEANRTAFRQWEKEWIASGITDSNTTKEWETLQRKIRTQEAIIPMLGISKTRFSVWRRRKACSRSSRMKAHMGTASINLPMKTANTSSIIRT